jgi:hypothetical protein
MQLRHLETLRSERAMALNRPLHVDTAVFNQRRHSEKDVAVNFNAIKPTQKNDKTYLTLNTTKDALNNAPGFKYDRQSTTWVPDSRASNEKRSSR